MSLPARARRCEGGELRVRSGCWKCRERRVKCPEQRPVCHHCQRLGLPCRYEIRLTWDAVRKGHGRPGPASSPASPAWTAYDVRIGEWMFLNTTLDDFEPRPDVARRPTSPPSPTASPDATGAAWTAPAPVALSPLALLPAEARLWDYFVHFITPRCALACNPYQDVLLRLAAALAPRGPLFDCIMAVAANQMQILGHGGESAVSALRRRNRALSALRCQVRQYEGQAGADMADTADTADTADQIIWSAVMMCFFEISLDCPQSWAVHAAFASSFLLAQAARRPPGQLASASHRFAASYLSAHYILASTAEDPEDPERPEHSDHPQHHRLTTFRALQPLTDDVLVHTLTGCSKRLVELIADTTEVALQPEGAEAGPTTPTTPSTPPSPRRSPAAADRPQTLRCRRDSIERGLHLLAESGAESLEVPVPVPSESPSPSSSLSPAFSSSSSAAPSPASSAHMLRCIREAKRLAALMYLYARVDHSDPGRPHMMRLTDRIVALVAGISTRTNTVLWPLFIVATLGVRPEADGHRRVVLAKLQELQQTRQLGNVRKARQAIEAVWTARDLRPADAARSWSILHGRVDAISLA